MRNENPEPGNIINLRERREKAKQQSSNGGHPGGAKHIKHKTKNETRRQYIHISDPLQTYVLLITFNQSSSQDGYE